jgi:hypothetical protein
MLPSSRRHVSRRRGAPGQQIETGPLTRGTMLSARPGAPPCYYLLARQSPWLHGAQGRASAPATGTRARVSPRAASNGAGFAPIYRRARRLCRDEAAGDLVTRPRPSTLCSRWVVPRINIPDGVRLPRTSTSVHERSRARERNDECERSSRSAPSISRKCLRMALLSIVSMVLCSLGLDNFGY